MLNKDKLVFDVTDGGDQVASFLKAADGTLLTKTTVSGKEALDVNVANIVDVTLAAGSEVQITDGTDTLAINADGSLNITDNGGSITVDAVNFDIRDLAFATDSVTAHQGGTWTIDSITNPVTVSATDLDIRNLDYSQDNVAIKGATGNQLVVNADGSINANVDVSVTNGSDKAEDAAHASGDIGTYILSVREDAPASSTSADGDYQSMKTDAQGKLWVTSTHQAMSHAAVSVTNTATQIAASALSNRRKLLVQNNGSKVVYLGGSGVTTSDGVVLNSGSSAELELGPGVALYGITAAGSSDIRFMQLA